MSMNETGTLTKSNVGNVSQALGVVVIGMSSNSNGHDYRLLPICAPCVECQFLIKVEATMVLRAHLLFSLARP